MADREDWNKRIIDEFRANAGKVAGPFQGAPMILVTHTGAKTGRKRTNPLVYLAEDGKYVIFGSKGGAPTNPDWYHNLKANPEAEAEVGTEKFAVVAEEATGAERDRLFEKQAGIMPNFAQYQANTKRKIPVMVLSRKG